MAQSCLVVYIIGSDECSAHPIVLQRTAVDRNPCTSLNWIVSLPDPTSTGKDAMLKMLGNKIVRQSHRLHIIIDSELCDFCADSNHGNDPFFQYVPMPVLYGVFLYMGVSSLYGLEVIFPRAWAFGLTFHFEQSVS